MHPDLILHNARITTLNHAAIIALAGPATRIVDMAGRSILPGLIDNYTHVLRGGLNYNMELRSDGVRSMSDAMGMQRQQVAITPPPQWVRIVGGFTEQQFTEKRLPRRRKSTPLPLRCSSCTCMIGPC